MYFDVRGAGLSVPKGTVHHRHDKFLRAKYIIEDIEAIRKKVLRDEPWDAVLSHSAGSVIAQTYANTYGMSSPGRKARLKTLMLSAPISRHIDVEPFREAGIADNLNNVLENHNSGPKCLFASDNVEAIQNKVAEVFAERLQEGGGRSKSFLAASNDFCFVKESQRAAIVKALKAKLDVIRKFGGVSFVFDNFDELRGTSAEFDREFPYPDQFFTALRTLDRLGSPIKKSSDASNETRDAKIDAALIVSYYLDRPRPKDAASEKCNPKAKFFENLNDDREADVAGEIYCARFQSIAPIYESRALLQDKNKSHRVVGALGLNQGIHRWLTMLLPTPSPASCNRGQDFIDFVNDPGKANETAKTVAGRVGFEADEEIRAWNPEKFKHEVPTLILKGGQDAAISGCQAEFFFHNGLASADKQFVEFPEFGHDWISELRLDRKKHLSTLLGQFISAPKRFAADASVKTVINNLGAKQRAASSINASSCSDK